MTNTQILSFLQELKPDSGKRISENVLTGKNRFGGQPAKVQLYRAKDNPAGYGYLHVPTNGVASLQGNTQAKRKLIELNAGDYELNSLNRELQGGESFPVLTAILGAIPVAGSLIFSAATTFLSINLTSHGVLARVGDQLWQVENIGKMGSDVIHVASYFLVDPYRGQSLEKGWLIHEKRKKLDV